MNLWEALCLQWYEFKVELLSLFPGHIERLHRQLMEESYLQLLIKESEQRTITFDETLNLAAMLNANRVTADDMTRALHMMASPTSYIEPYTPPQEQHYTLTMQDEGVVPDEIEQDGEKIEEQS